MSHQPADVCLPVLWENRVGAEPLRINADSDPRDLAREGMRRLVATNDPADLFLRAGQLVTVTAEGNETPTIKVVSHASLRYRLSTAAHWQRLAKDRDGAIVWVPTSPPRDVVSAVYGLEDRPLPPLRFLSFIPILRADGSVAATPGYDAQSGGWYAPGLDLTEGLGLKEPVTPARVQSAVALLHDWLVDFPFVDDADRASVLAFFLTTLARPLLLGKNVPALLLDATKERTGKTLLAQTLLLPMLGRLPAPTSAPQEEDEWRKFIMAQLLSGEPYLFLDNLNSRLDSATLAAVLTGGRYKGRILGASETAELPVDFVTVLTANNAEVSSELSKRAYLAKLDAQTARPERRTGFQHPDIEDYTLEHRAELLDAGFTILSAYLQAGRPAYTGPVKGGFAEWARLIGGALEYAGVPGFLSNEERLIAAAASDEGEAAQFLAAWYAAYGDRPIRVGQLHADASKPQSPLADALPTELAEVIGHPQSFTKKAGKWLAKRRGTRFGEPDMWLESREDSHTKSLVWRVCSSADAPSAAPDEDAVPALSANSHAPIAISTARRLLEEMRGAQ